MGSSPIAGRSALVTGASGGLGTEFVRQLRERGAKKVYAGVRRPAQFDDPGVEALALDVTNPDDIDAAARIATDVDLIVNNAGSSGVASLLTGDIADIRATFETNVFGPLAVVRAFAPVLAAHGGGTVVDIASVLSWLTGPGSYAPSKAALWGVTNALRTELAAQSTGVLAAHFAYVDTPMTAGLDVPKSAPDRIVSVILDAVEAGASEVLADSLTVAVHRDLPALSTGAQSGRTPYTDGADR